MSNNFKKIAFQYSYLKLEFEDTKKICKDKESEIRKFVKEKYPDEYDKFYSIGKYKKDTKIDPDKDQEKNTDECIDSLDEHLQKNTSNNEDLKKLYRKIARQTHPDVETNQDNSDLFREAVKAYNEENLANLIEIAFSLRIDIDNLSLESVELVKNNIASVEKNLFHQKKTLSWAWSQASSEEEKHKIVEHTLTYLNNKGD